MLEEIAKEAYDTGMSHSVWAGAAGAGLGGGFAVSQGYGVGGTVGLILAGHYAGHFIYAAVS